MTGAWGGKDRHIVISGGSRGLGKTLVSGLLDAGYRVSSFSRTATEFIQQQAGNDRFFFAPADLSDKSSMATFLKSAESLFGPPYGLINCAAHAADGLLAIMSEEAIRKLLSVNGEGTLRLTRLVVRRMLLAKTGGVILNISSISSLRGFRGMSAYAFTKGGIDAFTRALARELGEQNIRVNSIAPGYYDTDMTRNLNETQKRQILHRTPLGRLGVPEDVVGPVLFLLSDHASFITGQCLVVDGGSTV
ncbi:MAG: SDR family oxidoreductase [Acidobacteriia bacterium]|nr:SDR family oxidoreductase [Terriglobia bacterium]